MRKQDSCLRGGPVLRPDEAFDRERTRTIPWLHRPAWTRADRSNDEYYCPIMHQRGASAHQPPHASRSWRFRRAGKAHWSPPRQRTGPFFRPALPQDEGV